MTPTRPACTALISPMTRCHAPAEKAYTLAGVTLPRCGGHPIDTADAVVEIPDPDA